MAYYCFTNLNVDFTGIYLIWIIMTKKDVHSNKKILGSNCDNGMIMGICQAVGRIDKVMFDGPVVFGA